MVRDSLHEQVERIKALGQEMQAIEKRLARTIWALTAKDTDYQRGFKSVRPIAA
jgi:hypothetical protein